MCKLKKDRECNGQNKKDKQWSTKHYTIHTKNRNIDIIKKKKEKLNAY